MIWTVLGVAWLVAVFYPFWKRLLPKPPQELVYKITTMPERVRPGLWGAKPESHPQVSQRQRHLDL